MSPICTLTVAYWVYLWEVLSTLTTTSSFRLNLTLLLHSFYITSYCLKPRLFYVRFILNHRYYIIELAHPTWGDMVFVVRHTPYIPYTYYKHTNKYPVVVYFNIVVGVFRDFTKPEFCAKSKQTRSKHSLIFKKLI